jgi:predicted AlkP superfamily phosphohydrolase/phosphomutase
MNSFLAWENKYSKVIADFLYLVDPYTGELLLDKIKFDNKGRAILRTYYIGLYDGVLLL